MGFSRERCMTALELNGNNVEQAADWLLAHSMPDQKTSPPLPPPPSPPPASPNVSPSCETMALPSSSFRLEVMQTIGDGNCLFHALIGALRDLAERRKPGHRFPYGDLPMTHDRMRAAVVGFASGHRNDPHMFIENFAACNVSESIQADCDSHHGNNRIVGGGPFRSVDEYFQERCRTKQVFSRNSCMRCRLWAGAALGGSTLKSWLQQRISAFTLLCSSRTGLWSMLAMATACFHTFSCIYKCFAAKSFTSSGRGRIRPDKVVVY